MLPDTFQSRLHLVNSIHHYSMRDFVEIENGSLTAFVKSATSTLINHIYTCEVGSWQRARERRKSGGAQTLPSLMGVAGGDAQICKARGFICEFCQDDEVLYPFQLREVVQCASCKSFFHRKCYVASKCPKCLRLEAHRLRYACAQELGARRACPRLTAPNAVLV